jgi:hypothetical protein
MSVAVCLLQHTTCQTSKQALVMISVLLFLIHVVVGTDLELEAGLHRATRFVALIVLVVRYDAKVYGDACGTRVVHEVVVPASVAIEAKDLAIFHLCKG